MMRMLATFLTAVMFQSAAAPLAADVPHNVARLELLPGWRGVDGVHVAGLRIRLAPGWKTYWRSPGDGGIPPRLSLAGSANLAAADIAWPVPEVFYAYGLRSIGYVGDVVLPIRFRATDATAPIRLIGEIEIGVCEDICIPMTFSLDGILPARGGRDLTIEAALADRPMTAAEAGVKAVSCAVQPTADGLELSARISMPPLSGSEAAVVEVSDRSVWVSEADLARDPSGTSLTAVVDLVPESGGTFLLDRSGVRITVIGDGTAVDIRGCG